MADDLEQVILNTPDLGEGLSNKAIRAEALKRQVDSAIAAAYSQINNIHLGALVSLGEVEAQFALHAVNTTIGVNIAKTMLTNAALDLVVRKTVIEGAPSEEWWRRQKAIVAQRFSDTMTKGIMEGNTIPQLVQRVRGTRAHNYTDGIMSGTYARTEALVRTSGMTVANGVRMESYLANADIIKAIQWVATLDHATCVVCGVLDGLTWKTPDYTPQGHNKKFTPPPSHWNCRCTVVPVLKSYRELAGLPEAGRINSGTRASMNGQLPANMKFNAWLQTQSEEAQRAILGKTRYELWKGGKLSMAEMTRPSNELLTIEQLKKKLNLD